MNLSVTGIEPVAFSPNTSYQTVVSLDPIEDIDNMEEPRHVAIGFETYDGIIHDYRGAASFDRIPGTASYRYLIRGVQVKRNNDGSLPESVDLNDTIESMELRLTSRFEWYTKSQKIKGKETTGRIVRMRFLRSKDEEHPKAIRQIDLIIPRSENCDSGKLLVLAINQASALVDANIAESKLKEEQERQQAARLRGNILP
ncbi:unknown protein [Seminavis robusta]|uniref:Uncharacterized protein n=1 Tax=Seminavis robusta TaxID=568900 RepID=A0A9N8H9C6_9STRA|nr:unknown protein [Seminavis robusta]|eukprot:Sro114_g056220.1 n/a (200) ;mRNA; f:10867-11466